MQTNLMGRFSRRLAAVLGIMAACAIAPCHADQGEQSATVGVLGTSVTNNFPSSYLIDMNRRNPTGNCPYIYLLMHQAFGQAVIPPVQQNRTYPATIRVLADGTSMLNSIVINGVSYKVGLSQTWQCDPRPAPDGGHWEWVNNSFAAKPGVADPVQWLPAGANGGNAVGSQTSIPNVDIENQLDSEVTVTMDGQPGCTASPHRHCYFHAALGKHNFRAVSPAVDEPATKTFTLNPGETFHWAIWLEH